jgi:hypothetical protein
MKQIPFAAFPATERDAVLAALRAGGMAADAVCVSRVELAAEADGRDAALAMVSAPGWSRTYDATGPWTEMLQRDLAAWAARRATMPISHQEETR